MNAMKSFAKRRFRTILPSVCAASFLALSGPWAWASPVPPGFAEHDADVNGTRIHYRVGGKGSPVVLLHGYAETGHMWLPLMPLLAAHHTVIVPDLRGAGDSSTPESGLRQEEHGRGHPRAGYVAWDSRVQHRRPRHRPDGGLRLRRAISPGDRSGWC